MADAEAIDKEYDDDGNEIKAPPPPPMPGMQTRRMGKRWRIIYTETKNLAYFNNGRPVDGGGFLDEFVDGERTVDGELAAQQAMAMAQQGAIDTGLQGSGILDTEAEGVGN